MVISLLASIHNMQTVKVLEEIYHVLQQVKTCIAGISSTLSSMVGTILLVSLAFIVLIGVIAFLRSKQEYDIAEIALRLFRDTVENSAEKISQAIRELKVVYHMSSMERQHEKHETETARLEVRSMSGESWSGTISLREDEKKRGEVNNEF